MAENRRVYLWELVVARATSHRRAASAADVCQVAVTMAQLSGGWVTAATDGGPGFVMYVSGGVAEQLNEQQLMLGEGPCRDVFTSAAPVLASNLADDQSSRRWPAFTAAAATLGARSVFAFPLMIGTIRSGVMGLYRDSSGPLSPRQLGDCLLLTDTATVLLLEGASGDGDHADGNGLDGGGPRLAGQPPELAAHRAEIDQATGMLTVQLEVSAAEAFARLRAYAYVQDRRLAEVARDIVTRQLRLAVDPAASDS
jgi:hypothetical protein